MTRVLLIDLEDERARQVERKLRLWGLECIVADSFLYALTMVEWQPPDLVLIRAPSSDGMTASEFGATVKQDPKLRDIPLVFVAESDIDTVPTLRGFDLVLEPADNRTLLMQLTRFLKKHRLSADSQSAAADSASSSDHTPSEVSLGDLSALIEEISLSLKSGRLMIHVDDHPGQIFVVFDHGRLIHAIFGGLDGPPAFRRLLQELGTAEKHTYLFEPEPRWKVGTYPRTIRQADRQRLLDPDDQPDGYDTQVVFKRLSP